jgi:hypothetical protein
MFREYAVTPDVLDPMANEDEEDLRSTLRGIHRELKIRGFLRDVGGEWWDEIKSAADPTKSGKSPRKLSMATAKLLKYLASPRRKVLSDRSGVKFSGTWLDKALKSHEGNPLQGIIASDLEKKEFSAKRKQIVASGGCLEDASWWEDPPMSSRSFLRRTKDYQDVFGLLLKNAKKIHIFSRWMDLSVDRYDVLKSLLKIVIEQNPRAEVHLHRTKNKGDHGISHEEWAECFDWLKRNNTRKNSIKAHVWDRRELPWHKRCFLTEIGGLTLDHEFIIDRSKERTTCSIMDPMERDEDIAKLDAMILRQENLCFPES